MVDAAIHQAETRRTELILQLPEAHDKIEIYTAIAGTIQSLIFFYEQKSDEVNTTRARAALVETRAEANIARAEANIARAEANIARAESGVARAEAAFDQAADKASQARARATLARARAEANIARAEAGVARAEAGVAQTKVGVARFEANIALFEAKIGLVDEKILATNSAQEKNHLGEMRNELRADLERERANLDRRQGSVSANPPMDALQSQLNAIQSILESLRKIMESIEVRFETLKAGSIDGSSVKQSDLKDICTWAEDKKPHPTNRELAQQISPELLAAAREYILAFLDDDRWAEVIEEETTRGAIRSGIFDNTVQFLTLEMLLKVLGLLQLKNIQIVTELRYRIVPISGKIDKVCMPLRTSYKSLRLGMFEDKFNVTKRNQMRAQMLACSKSFTERNNNEHPNLPGVGFIFMQNQAKAVKAAKPAKAAAKKPARTATPKFRFRCYSYSVQNPSLSSAKVPHILESPDTENHSVIANTIIWWLLECDRISQELSEQLESTTEQLEEDEVLDLDEATDSGNGGQPGLDKNFEEDDDDHSDESDKSENEPDTKSSEFPGGLTLCHQSYGTVESKIENCYFLMSKILFSMTRMDQSPRVSEYCIRWVESVQESAPKNAKIWAAESFPGVF